MFNTQNVNHGLWRHEGWREAAEAAFTTGKEVHRHEKMGDLDVSLDDLAWFYFDTALEVNAFRAGYHYGVKKRTAEPGHPYGKPFKELKDGRIFATDLFKGEE